MATFVTFGLAGAGKTYFANWFAKKFKVHFADADHWLTAEMRACISKGEIFTPDMLDRYFVVVSEHITALKAQHKHLMISQALYLERNRQQILRDHPDVTFILVAVEDNVLKRRLIARKNGVSLEYARENESYFERPQHACIHIDNSEDDSDTHLMSQCLQHEEIASLPRAGRLHSLFSPALIRIRNFTYGLRR